MRNATCNELEAVKGGEWVNRFFDGDGFHAKSEKNTEIGIREYTYWNHDGTIKIIAGAIPTLKAI